MVSQITDIFTILFLTVYSVKTIPLRQSKHGHALHSRIRFIFYNISIQICIQLIQRNEAETFISMQQIKWRQVGKKNIVHKKYPLFLEDEYVDKEMLLTQLTSSVYRNLGFLDNYPGRNNT